MRFGRTWRFVAGDNANAFEIGPPFQIRFDIDKTPAETPNIATISLFNLSRDRQKQLEKPDQRCQLFAGYEGEGEPVLICSGAIVDAYTYHDDANVVTEVGVYDGWIELRDTAVSVGYSGGIDAHTVIRAIAAQMGLPLMMDSSLPNKSWKNGWSFYGAAHSALHKLTSAAGLEWSIQNQQIQVIGVNGRTQREAIVLEAGGGMLGFPERTRRGAIEKATVDDQATGNRVRLESAQQQKDGWRVRSLLLPMVNPGDTLILRSVEVEEICRADVVRHTGDFVDGDWATDLLLVSNDRYTAT